MSNDFTPYDIEKIVEAAVFKTMNNLGIDLSTAEARREFIEDQYYTRAWRKGVQKGAKWSFMTIITVFVTGLMGVLWVGLQYTIGMHP